MKWFNLYFLLIALLPNCVVYDPPCALARSTFTGHLVIIDDQSGEIISGYDENGNPRQYTPENLEMYTPDSVEMQLYSELTDYCIQVENESGRFVESGWRTYYLRFSEQDVDTLYVQFIDCYVTEIVQNQDTVNYVTNGCSSGIDGEYQLRK